MKYTQAGEYELIYTASDSCGNETTETRNITVIEPTPQDILLMRGGAEEFELSDESVSSGELTTITPVYDGEYAGAIEVRFFNLQYKVNDDPDWTVFQESSAWGENAIYSPNEWHFFTELIKDSFTYVDAEGTSVEIRLDSRHTFIKWDSLEIWGRAEG